MDNNYDEFEGTEFDPSADVDFDFDDEQDDLVPILSLAAVFAAIVGAVLVLVGRRRNPTPQERAEELLKEARKQGKKGVKAASKGMAGVKLGDLLSDAIDQAKDAAGRVDAGGVLSETRKRARKAAKSVDLRSMLDDALSQANDAAKRLDLADTAQAARKGVARATETAREAATGMDLKGVENVLDTLKTRLADAIDSVRSDIAPNAADRLKEDIIPAAQELVETATKRVREDVIPAAQERAGGLADQYHVTERARKAASTAKEGAVSVGDILRQLALAFAARVVEDVVPTAKKTGTRVARTAREDVIPAAAQTAGEAAQRVREDVLPRVGEAAAQTPDLMRAALHKVEDAIGRVQPLASDAFLFSRHRAEDVASGVKGRSDGMGGAVRSAGRGVTGAVGSAVGATTSAARETSGLVFWLSMLAGLILMVWVPDRDKQKEIMDNVFQFVGELREMWTDLQEVAAEPDTAM